MTGHDAFFLLLLLLFSFCILLSSSLYGPCLSLPMSGEEERVSAAVVRSRHSGLSKQTYRVTYIVEGMRVSPV